MAPVASPRFRLALNLIGLRGPTRHADARDCPPVGLMKPVLGMGHLLFQAVRGRLEIGMVLVDRSMMSLGRTRQILLLYITHFPSR